jgi:hypothetical protein
MYYVHLKEVESKGEFPYESHGVESDFCNREGTASIS